MTDDELLKRMRAAREGTLVVTEDELRAAIRMIHRANPERVTPDHVVDLAQAAAGDDAARQLNERNRKAVDEALARARDREYSRIREQLTLTWLSKIDPLSCIEPRGTEIVDTFAETVREISIRAHEAAIEIAYAGVGEA